MFVFRMTSLLWPPCTIFYILATTSLKTPITLDILTRYLLTSHKALIDLIIMIFYKLPGHCTWQVWDCQQSPLAWGQSCLCLQRVPAKNLIHYADDWEDIRPMYSTHMLLDDLWNTNSRIGRQFMFGQRNFFCKKKVKKNDAVKNRSLKFCDMIAWKWSLKCLIAELYFCSRFSVMARICLNRGFERHVIKP